jgi:NAD(P)-dependent dehydrogenase (short-subunit alcohol dehydrogenase family)
MAATTMKAPFPSPTSKWHFTAYQSVSPRRSELSAKGKTILITGGGTGIGAETARSFAEAGASRIALLGRRKQPLLDTKASLEHKFRDVEVFIASTDVTERSEVEAAFSEFCGKGKIDVLVSNAAIIGPLESVQDVNVGEFLQAVEQNLRGSLNIAQVFLQYAARDAVAIETNSSAAHVNFVPLFASYSVAKLGVFRLWDSLAFANPNLRVYHVQPGVVKTEMSKKAGGTEAMGFEDHGKFK